MIVAIVGVDGCGKTTQAQMLVERLKRAGCDTVYIRPVYAILRCFTGRKHMHTLPVSPRKVRVSGAHTGFGKLLLLAMGVAGYFYALASYIFIKYLLCRNKIVVCDRYFYQFFYDNFGRFSKTIAGLFPRPGVIFYLTGEVNALQARMTSSFDLEVDQSYYRSVIEMLNELSVKYSFIKIDAQLNKKQINDEIFNCLSKKINIGSDRMDYPSPLQVVLTVVDPDFAKARTVDISKFKANKRLFKSAVALAKKNGFYYCLISKLKELPGKLPFLNEKCWRDENRRLEEFTRTVELLNNISVKYQLNYILFKHCNTYPHIPRDVDIFVNKDAQLNLLSALETAGMKYEQLNSIETSIEKKGFLKVDVYTQVSYFAVEFIDGDYLRRHQAAGAIFGIQYPGLDMEANLLLALVHSLFGHRSMSLLDFLHIKHLRRHMADFASCRAYACQKGWGPSFDLIMTELDNLMERVYEKGETIKFPYIFSKQLILACVSTVDGLHIKNKLAFSLSLALDRLRESQRNSFIYNLLKKFKPSRVFLNQLITFVRIARGDGKAVAGGDRRQGQ
jgi:thymidylate kinase